ncbi:phage major capsid protein [Methylocystis echinoides]|uniref:Major capsid protein n=1 Tax=Methylocystis echinoides TaxID=29468 RepID=A0A9W6GVT3_9HYPH|nr:phage major capsid protein [Methylocystis echinoides]GLI93947.1 major capsid protein [Methylocystis echinoides]
MGVTGRPFYTSKRWARVRFLALRRDGFACVKCGSRTRLEIDHIEAIRKAPERAFDLDNLQTLCRDCHAAKTDKELGHAPTQAKRAWQSAVAELARSHEGRPMLESVKISRRQSEIRQALAAIVGKETPSEDETRSMETMDAEYRTNETRYRAALIAEDQERREAKGELETRGDREFADLVSRFEMRQAVLNIDEGRALTGPTAEIVSELRNRGGYRGVPVPWAALEMRAGETVASGTPDPIRTAPIIDRLFAASAAARMGAQFISIDSGEIEYPVCTSSIAAAWASTETGSVGSPAAYETTDKPLTPANTLGIQMKVTRKAMKQSGDALEQAIRRDMNGAIGVALDEAVFLGAGASGEPAGVLVGSYGITSTNIGAASTWAVFRAAIVRFMTANAAAGPGDVMVLMRPEVWDVLDGTLTGDGGFKFEFDRLKENVGGVVISSNALAAPTGSPLASKALLTTRAGGVPPIYVGAWGAVDLIRDPYSDAASGGLRLTALATMDVTVSRPAQLEILTGLQ